MSRLNKRKMVLLIALVFILGVTLVACGTEPPAEEQQSQTEAPKTPEDPEAAKYGGTITVAYDAEISSMDLHWTMAAQTKTYATHAMEYLVGFDEQWQVRPMLADRWEVSDNGLEYTFYLRKNVPFHDGTIMKAQDVVASLNRWMLLSPQGKTLAENVASLEEIDEYTVKITVKETTGTLITTLASDNQGAVIYPKHLIDEVGAENEIMHPIGTGPYEFVEWQPDRWVIFRRFEDYASRDEPFGRYAGGKTAYIDEIKFVPVLDTSVRQAGVETGEYDVAVAMSSDQYEDYLALDNVDVMIPPFTGWEVIVFNKKQGWMSDQRMRQAFLAGMDVKAWSEFGGGHPDLWDLHPCVLGKETVWYTDVGKERQLEVNPERAKTLLEEAGYDGTPLRWLVSSQKRYDEALFVASQLEPIGFKFDIQLLDWPSMLEKRSDPSAYDIFGTGNTPKLDPVQIAIFQPTWPGWWETPEYLAVLEALNKEHEFDKRFELFEQAMDLFWEQVPGVKGWDYGNPILLNPRVKDFRPLHAPVLWNVWLDKGQ